MVMKKYLVLTAACLGLTACAQFGNQEYSQRAQSLVSKQTQWQQSQTDSHGQSLSLGKNESQAERLSLLLNLPEVQQLIDTATEHSPSLKQSELDIAIADIQTKISHATFWPSLSAGMNISGKEASSGEFSPSIGISWAADIWGKQRDTSRAQNINLDIAKSNFNGAKSLLGANIITAYLNLIRAQQLIAIESKRLTVLEQNQVIIVNRYKRGLGDLQSLDTARSSTESARASLESYREQFKQSKASLALLLGQTQLSLDVPQAFPHVLNPVTGIASQDLGRRPDLQVAYSKIHYNEQQISIAYKSLLPSLNLTGSLAGASSSSLQDSLQSSSSWSLLGQLTAPLFQGGRLKSQVELAKLTTEQSFWGYKQTLLAAVNETEKALSAELSLAKRQEYLQQAAINAQRSFTHYNRKYQQGLVSLIDLLQVQQQTFNLESQVVEIQYQRLANRITLGLALGWGV